MLLITGAAGASGRLIVDALGRKDKYDVKGTGGTNRDY